MYAKFFKRIIDFVLSLTAIIILLPLFLILTLAGAIAMKGNPYFVQKRPGKIDKKSGQEQIISLLKFRTMTNECDQDGALLPDDKRLTRYGQFLRRTSLDELPELINILAGQMSIVGPRPLLVQYISRYSKEQRQRHNVLPGLTGYAQAYGRNSLSWEERFEKDVYYVEHISFWLDIKIIFKTIAIVLKQEGVSSETSATMEEFMGIPAKEETHV